MLRLASIFFCLIVSHSAAAQSIDFGQILQRGVNEAVRSMTAPPPPVYQPPTQPPYSAPQKPTPSRPAKVQRKAPVKSAGAAASGLSAAAGSSGAAGAQASTMPKTTVTRSPLMQPIALPMYQGLPIANTLDPRRNVAGGSMQQMGLWLGLINLSHNAALFDSPKTAFPIAKDYVAKEYWDTYFRCLKQPCSSTFAQGQAPAYHTVVAWAGDNEFARARSYKAFVENYRGILLAEAASLPLDIYFVTTVKLGEYTLDQGGMPLDWAAGDLRAGGQKPTARPDNKTPPAILRKIGLAPTVYADTRLATPLVLPCTLDACEKILMQTSNRTLYALLKLRVLAIDNLPDERGRVGNIAVPIGPVALYAHPTLNKPVFQFPGVDVPLPALLAPGFSPFRTGPMPFNTDSMHLLVLKHHPNGAHLLNHQQASQARKQVEEKLHDLALESGWPADDPWGPFFPAVGAPALPLDADIIKKFQAWSMQRAQAIPSALTLRFRAFSTDAGPKMQGMQRLVGMAMPANHWISGSGDLQVRTGTRMEKDESLGILVQSGQIDAADKLLLVSLPGSHNLAGLSNDVILSFPEPVASYAMPTPATASAAPSPGYSSPTDQNRVSHTELDVLIKEVSFVPGPRGDTMVLQLEPQQGRLYTHAALIGESRIDPVNISKKAAADTALHAPLFTAASAAAIAEPAAPFTLNKGTATIATATQEPPAQLSFDHDIVGLKLGMPAEEADTIVRRHMEPELIYSLMARNPAQGYQQGRLYISFKLNESIVLAHTADDKLAAIERQLVLPPQVPRESVLRQLVAKYGEPQRKLGPTWNWWSRQPPAYCLNAPMQVADVGLLEGVEPDADSPLSLKLHAMKKNSLPFSYTDGAMRAGSSPDRTTCLPVLGAAITTMSSGAGDTRNVMRFVMYDHGAYTRAQSAAVPTEMQQIEVKM